MAIPRGHKSNFNALLRAAKNGDLALLECYDAKTNTPVFTICMANRGADRSITFVPVAKMFDGNPYDELMPPT